MTFFKNLLKENQEEKALSKSNIANTGPERIYGLAADWNVNNFVVPGNKVEFVQYYRLLFEGMVGEGNFTLYAPGFIGQGGDISETGKEEEIY